MKFQSKNKSCKENVISIETPWNTICTEKSEVAGLILPDATIKRFGGSSLGDDINEYIKLPYSIKIESGENNSAKRKRTDQ